MILDSLRNFAKAELSFVTFVEDVKVERKKKKKKKKKNRRRLKKN